LTHPTSASARGNPGAGGVGQSEQRTGTYGKSKPSILDGIRNFDSEKFNNAPKPPNEQRGVTERV